MRVLDIFSLAYSVSRIVDVEGESLEPTRGLCLTPLGTAAIAHMFISMCTQTQISCFSLKPCLISFSLDKHTLFCESTGTIFEQLPLNNCQCLYYFTKNSSTI